MEDIEELQEENCEIETRTEFDLNWTCANCKREHIELDIPIRELTIFTCHKCGKRYEYYCEPY